jgi:hypothetical protein
MTPGCAKDRYKSFLCVWGHRGTGNAFDTDFYNGVSGAVPEPTTLALLGSGLLGLVMMRRRKQRAQK